ncbi:MAG: hypothetical protein HZA16_05355 [Nitrospirae bacterium]|nr:hypothetical protein [Nitrospirota bacterium]
MDNRIKILIAFPFVFVIILFIAAKNVPLKLRLTAAEEGILTFAPAELAVEQRPEVPVSREIKSPLRFGVPQSGAVRAADEDITPETDYEDNALSLIVVSGNRKMAIIRGIIVREGDNIDGMRIVRIEPEKVLVKGRTERWIYPEKTR